MITLIMSILITSMVFIAPLNAVSLALITNGIVGRPYFSLQNHFANFENDPTIMVIPNISKAG